MILCEIIGKRFIINDSGEFIKGDKLLKDIFIQANKRPYATWDGPVDYRVASRMTDNFTTGSIVKYKPIKLNEKVVY